jgi:GTP-dependent phosphoenolpyruvate carboxykinase
VNKLLELGLYSSANFDRRLFNLGLEKAIQEINYSHQVEVVNKEIILAYADDIVILGNTRQDITQTMSNLVTASKRMGLYINEEKTKFMVLSRREDQPNLLIDNFTFESVESFKYLGVNINNKHDMHQEILERLASGN